MKDWKIGDIVYLDNSDLMMLDDINDDMITGAEAIDETMTQIIGMGVTQNLRKIIKELALEMKNIKRIPFWEKMDIKYELGEFDYSYSPEDKILTIIGIVDAEGRAEAAYYN